jgi:hypothetical protein
MVDKCDPVQNNPKAKYDALDDDEAPGTNCFSNPVGNQRAPRWRVFRCVTSRPLRPKFSQALKIFGVEVQLLVSHHLLSSPNVNPKIADFPQRLPSSLQRPLVKNWSEHFVRICSGVAFPINASFVGRVLWLTLLAPDKSRRFWTGGSQAVCGGVAGADRSQLFFRTVRGLGASPIPGLMANDAPAVLPAS